MKTRSSTRIIILVLLTAFIMSACVQEAPSTPVQPESTVAGLQPTLTAIPTVKPPPTGYITYLTQSGDTLPVVAAHFGLEMHQIKYEGDLDRESILPPGTRLYVRDLLQETSKPDLLFLDSEVIFSRSVIGFDIHEFADEQGGLLAQHQALMTRGTTPATDILYDLALEFSINPRILLSLMEYESGWVTRNPVDDFELDYPFGWEKRDRTDVYFQTGWAVNQLTLGYYGWRDGSLTEITFTDGTTLRLSPYLNAGTAAVMYVLAQIHDRPEWENALYGEESLVDVYLAFFGDPQSRAVGVEPLFPAGTEQPQLNLPIPINQKWNLTSGPHSAWGRSGPRAALDFSPPLNSPGCGNSERWATAAAAGRVVRAGNGVVVLDLDMDGYEQTGWVLVYMHLANTGRVQVGDVVKQDDNLGHPSCEGGSSSGIHVHIVRKFNGEWVLADGGLPFVMSGYRAKNGEETCDYAWWRWCRGTLSNGEFTAVADPFGNFWTRIIRPESRPELFYTPTPKK